MRFFLSALTAGCLGLAASAATTVGDLRCEYAVDPIGIDTLQPRLSWVLRSDERNQTQAAYQVRVAASRDDLAAGRNLLWDTGKVASDQNVHIVYAGVPLASGSRCYWTVRVWPATRGATADRPSPWSVPSRWQVALLNASDWMAVWVGPQNAGTPAWGDFTLSTDLTLKQDAVGILFRMSDADNGYMWQFNRALSHDFVLRPHVCRNGTWSMLPAVSLRSFINEANDFKQHHIEIETRGATIRTRVDGRLVDERNDTAFARGTVGFRASDGEHASVRALSVKDTTGQVLLAADFAKGPSIFPKNEIKNGQMEVPAGVHLYRPPLPKDCPRLRKDFVLDKPVRSATASVCGLGFYELFLNGTKAGDRVLAPANTSYGRLLLFDTLDVTSLVKPGANSVGLWLAPGYSDDYSKWGWKWEEGKRVLLQINVVYEDGTKAWIGTDSSWRCGPSPLSFASLYDGEVFDANAETPGWATPAFRGDDWKTVAVLSPLPARFAPNVMPPVRVVQTLRPVAVQEPKPGVFVFDMGQNFAGVVRVRATGPSGTRIVLRHSELVGKDGMLDPWTNRRAKATDTFVLRGIDEETYQPRFTYHGFRYVEVTGYPGRPTLDDVTGCVVGADVASDSAFTCSDATLNRLQSNCVWSMRSNFMSIPTDCCMRDERTPCQMDSLAYEDAALCNFWMNRFYTKWMDDIAGGTGNPDWNGDQVFLPWRLYTCYGDRRILERHYDAMRTFADWLYAKAPDGVWTDGFGDWCPPNNGTWEGFHGNVTEVNTALYAELTRIVGETAAVLGKADDAARYRARSTEIARAFNAKRFDATKAAYGNGSQTAALLPLAFGLVPSENRDAVLHQLTDTIRGKDRSRLDTGIFGTRYLLDVLSDGGQSDLGVELLTQPEYPGFGFEIANGATTLWEQWTIKGGMNSHNHAMFAGVSASLFTRLGGITALKPGFSEIGIRPVMPANLSFVEATQETVQGPVSVRWQRTDKGVDLDVAVPVNTTARISVPAASKESVFESGRPAAQCSDLGYVAQEGFYAVFRVGSGRYHFSTK